MCLCQRECVGKGCLPGSSDLPASSRTPKTNVIAKEKNAMKSFVIGFKEHSFLTVHGAWEDMGTLNP